MIVYTSQCLACTNRALWKKIKTFSNKYNLPIEERRVTRNKYWKDEADQYEIPLPFVVHNRTALSLTEDLESLL